MFDESSKQQSPASPRREKFANFLFRIMAMLFWSLQMHMLDARQATRSFDSAYHPICWRRRRPSLHACFPGTRAVFTCTRPRTSRANFHHHPASTIAKTEQKQSYTECRSAKRITKSPSKFCCTLRICTTRTCRAISALTNSSLLPNAPYDTRARRLWSSWLNTGGCRNGCTVAQMICPMVFSLSAMHLGRVDYLRECPRAQSCIWLTKRIYRASRGRKKLKTKFGLSDVQKSHSCTIAAQPRCKNIQNLRQTNLPSLQSLTNHLRQYGVAWAPLRRRTPRLHSQLHHDAQRVVTGATQPT